MLISNNNGANSADLIKELKRDGARFVRNDKEANQALRKNQHIVLSLCPGDTILIEEELSSESNIADGPWLAVVYEDSSDDASGKISVKPIDWFNSKILQESGFGYLLSIDHRTTPKDEFTVIRRHGHPILEVLKSEESEESEEQLTGE